MFAKTIIDSDAFLDMPVTSQLLYFHLSMRADDEGFINKPKTIMRMSGCKEDDMKLLIAKKFIIPFDSGIVVIKHWKIHNYIAKDRYTETKYKDEKSQLKLDENKAYSLSNGTHLIDNNNVAEEKKEYSKARIKRIQAKKNSDLPYSFDYKIRNAFIGEKCPICGCTMTSSSDIRKPTIQHNIPISKGGKHEISNISVICSSCNCSIQNRKITEPYNTDKVIEVWERIQSQSNPETQVRLGKDREGKVREVEESCCDDDTSKVFSIFEKCGFKITGYTKDELTDLINTYTADWTIEAIKRSADRGKKTIGYIKGILNSWDQKGSIDSGTEKQQKNTASNHLDDFYDMAADWASKSE